MTTFAERPPTVKFLGGPENPLSIIYETWQRSRDYIVIDPENDAVGRREDEVRVWKELTYAHTQIPEFVKYSWWIDGMPRSFFDQMTRYRKTGFFARSQRIRNQTGFAIRGDYLTTPKIATHPKAVKIYRNAMKQVGIAHAKLIKMGIPAEDARGLLPLHLRTGFGWTLTLRDLAEVFKARTCHLLQQDYWAHVGERMRLDLSRIEPEFNLLFQPPCARDNECGYPLEATARVKAVLQDGRMDLFPCKIFHDRFTSNKIKPKVQHLVDSGQTRWAKSMQEILCDDREGGGDG